MKIVARDVWRKEHTVEVSELSRDGLTSAEQTYMQQAEWAPLSEVDTMPQVGSVDIAPVIRNVARKEYENG